MEQTLASLLTVLPAGEIDARPWEPMGSLEGVRSKTLWRDADSMAGVLRIDAGHRLGAHTHRANHHHMWIIEGRATIAGAELGPGGYVHIPDDVEHDIDATGTDGCTLFYLYLRPAT